MIKQDINVTIGRFGSESQNVSIPANSTVGDALSEVGMSFTSAEKVVVNGERASSNDILEDGDIVNVFTPKEAGSVVAH